MDTGPRRLGVRFRDPIGARPRRMDTLLGHKTKLGSQVPHSNRNRHVGADRRSLHGPNRSQAETDEHVAEPQDYVGRRAATFKVVSRGVRGRVAGIVMFLAHNRSTLGSDVPRHGVERTLGRQTMNI